MCVFPLLIAMLLKMRFSGFEHCYTLHHSIEFHFISVSFSHLSLVLIMIYETGKVFNNSEKENTPNNLTR